MPATLHQGSDAQNFEPNPALPAAETNIALEEGARQVGQALGRTVAALRETGTRLKNTASDATDAAVSRIHEVKRQVRRGYSTARVGAQQLLHDHPVRVVLAAGAAGLLLGAGLRLWRASHD